METFRELCDGKISNAIYAMIEGLFEMHDNPDFEIDMRVFGYSDGHICYGCAATCAIQKLVGSTFTTDNIGRTTFSVIAEDFYEFEGVIDSLRLGYLKNIWLYFGYGSDDIVYPQIPLEQLVNYNWQDNIEDYRQYADQLSSLGF